MCHFNSTESTQSCSHFGTWDLVKRIAISVLPSTHLHLSQVKHLRVTCLPKDTTSNQCHKIEREKRISLKNPALVFQSRTAGSDIGKPPRSNHCAITIRYSISTNIGMFDPLYVLGRGSDTQRIVGQTLNCVM